MINHHVSLLSQTLTNNELCPICVPHWHYPFYPIIFRQVPHWSQTSHLVLLAKTTQRWAKLIWRSVGIVVQLWSRHILPLKLQGDAGEMRMGHDGSRFFHFLRGLLPKKHGSNPHYCKVLESIAPPNLQIWKLFLVLKMDKTTITWHTIRPRLQLPKVQ